MVVLLYLILSLHHTHIYTQGRTNREGPNDWNPWREGRRRSKKKTFCSSNLRNYIVQRGLRCWIPKPQVNVFSNGTVRSTDKMVRLNLYEGFRLSHVELTTTSLQNLLFVPNRNISLSCTTLTHPSPRPFLKSSFSSNPSSAFFSSHFISSVVSFYEVQDPSVGPNRVSFSLHVNDYL